MSKVRLSAVVIGRNEGERLTACLKSIRAANEMPEALELIYVDSNSTDGSPERAESLGAIVIVLGPGKLSAARARNAGWRIATAPFILFLDGDTTLDRDFVRRALSEFEDRTVAVVYGNRREVRPGASVYNRVLDLDWIVPPGDSEFCGGDSIMRRESLERANGFNPDLIAGEEPDLCRRLRGTGARVLHINVPMTSHDLALRSLGQYWRRAIRTGHAYAEIASRYKDSSDPLWTRESHGNFLRGSLYLAISVAACLGAIVLGSWLPLLALATAGCAIAVRTAFLARWKAVSWGTLLLFGFHSHIQHIPILQGQILYFCGRWRGQRRELIEYKSS